MSRVGSSVSMGLAVIGLNLALAMPALAQVCAKPSGTYETFGDIVIDKNLKLAWKRCSDGQSWNGTTCSGRATSYTFKEALTASSPSSDGFVWRTPRPDELATLVITNSVCLPAIDQDVFPRTAAGSYWTSQPLPKVPDGGYCQSFAAGASAERQDCWGGASLRLVSALPPGGYSPPTPIASSFVVEDSGSQLVVTGSNFSTTLTDNLISFPTTSGVRRVVPTSGSPTSLMATIPEDTTTGTITVTTKGVTSQPAPGTLRVINNKDGCVAAGFTPATIWQSTTPWDYCIISPGFQDNPADVLIVGAHSSKLPQTQRSFILSTSHLEKASSATFTLTGRIVLQFSPSGVHGALVVPSNAGRDADTFTSTGAFANNGLVDNRGNFNNLGSFVNAGNGVILNSGIFTNNPSGGKVLSIATTGSAIHNVSFSNASVKAWPRAQLKNLGTMVTQSGSTGIENAHADIVNSGTLFLQGAFAFFNRSGFSPGAVTNNGTIQIRIATQPEGLPIVSNEPGALIINNSGASITNAQALWTFKNIGIVQNCGVVNGFAPGPNGYAPCPVAKPRGR